MQRLQKILAEAGFGARRKCELIIAAGRVKVNGTLITEEGTKVDPQKDVIEVDGTAIHAQRKVYIMLNKPPGCITTVNDPQGRKTVMEYISDIPERVFPVGRLDKDTEGLLLFTNDGEFANRITHPNSKVYKTYETWITGVPSKEQLERLRRGVPLGDAISSQAQVRLVKAGEVEITRKGRLQSNKNYGTRPNKFGGGTLHGSLVEIRILEGRKRQVKRMIKAIGFCVISLKRTSVGGLGIEGLSEGKYKYLNQKDIELIFQVHAKGAEKAQSSQRNIDDYVICD
ncbi:MAG: pseudouridine synthase [bacterium]